MLSLIADVLFRILLGPAPLPPTAAELEAHDEADPFGASQWTPWDEFEWRVEWREEMLWLGLLFTARWKLSGLSVFGRQPLLRFNPFRHGRANSRSHEARYCTYQRVRRIMRSAEARP